MPGPAIAACFTASLAPSSMRTVGTSPRAASSASKARRVPEPASPMMSGSRASAPTPSLRPAICGSAG
jgi:hypothetical protein